MLCRSEANRMKHQPWLTSNKCSSRLATAFAHCSRPLTFHLERLGGKHQQELKRNCCIHLHCCMQLLSYIFSTVMDVTKQVCHPQWRHWRSTNVYRIHRKTLWKAPGLRIKLLKPPFGEVPALPADPGLLCLQSGCLIMSASSSSKRDIHSSSVSRIQQLKQRFLFWQLSQRREL